MSQCWSEWDCKAWTSCEHTSSCIPSLVSCLDVSPHSTKTHAIWCRLVSRNMAFLLPVWKRPVVTDSRWNAFPHPSIVLRPERISSAGLTLFSFYGRQDLVFQTLLRIQLAFEKKLFSLLSHRWSTDLTSGRHIPVIPRQRTTTGFIRQSISCESSHGPLQLWTGCRGLIRIVTFLPGGL